MKDEVLQENGNIEADKMEIKGKKVMILGGFGEVGFAICRKLLQEQPKELIVTSLRKEEAFEAARKLQLEAPNSCILTPVYGNLFVRLPLKDATRDEILANPQYQQWLAEDALEELTEEILTSSTLYEVISEYCPEIIVDCINTATAIAYQNVYQSYKTLSQNFRTCKTVEELTKGMYDFLSTLYIPLLVRHIQILYETMRRNKTLFYMKIGTTGTGGMGFNIPFTHGEEQPSRLLLSKSAIAGAHTLLLFLLDRTPGGPIVKELKPATLIGWKGFGKGRILKYGYPVPLYDCPSTEGYRLVQGGSFCYEKLKIGSGIDGREVEGVYVDTGENGFFSPDEFKVVTALDLMQYITPEEIAEVALLEIHGVNTSKDVIGAIAGAVMGSTYRAGLLRQKVIRETENLGEQGIAYGLLGPRITKLIFEAHLIRKSYNTFEKALQPLPEEISYTLEKEVERDQEIRSGALSIGIPILLTDGKTLLFAQRFNKDKKWEEENWVINLERVEEWAQREWIDLRPQNMLRWQEWLRTIYEEIKKSSGDTSSHMDCGSRFWLRNEKGEILIDPGEVVGWILIKEGR